MTDTERERHIADCGRLMQAAMARYQQSSDLADLGDAHRWRRLMEEAIAGRSAGQVARMEKNAGLS
jgi:hypothetical protein